jgi:UDP-N-acetylmuramate--alanine ligase
MNTHVHLVGIGGAGLSGIAKVLMERGVKVTGSDREASPYTQSLIGAGISVSLEHAASNIAGAELLLASSAIPEDNPEIMAANQAGIPVKNRRDYLGELTEGYRTIAIAGTHGKTTTTGMLAWLLDQTSRSPTFIAGGMLRDLDTNASVGSSDLFLIEADEYEQTFLGLNPEIAVVTNVEHDHPDTYPTEAEMVMAFEQFSAQVAKTLIVCADDPGARTLAQDHHDRTNYGTEESAEWRAVEIHANNLGGSDFDVLRSQTEIGTATLQLPGVHNIRNALAAIVVMDTLGVGLEALQPHLPRYSGVSRRFELLGQARGVTVIDDYAHHPSEIRATLRAARDRYPQHSITAVFQPHTYSRSRVLIEELSGSFTDADHVIVTEVFAAREQPDPAFGGTQIAERILQEDVQFIPDLEQAADYLLRRLGENDVLITLSAGDGNLVARLVLKGLEAQGEGAGHATHEQ